MTDDMKESKELTPFQFCKAYTDAVLDQINDEQRQQVCINKAKEYYEGVKK